MKPAPSRGTNSGLLEWHSVLERPSAMNDIAAGLGNSLCSAALEIGFAGAQIAHCYNAAAHQQLGYSAVAVLVLVTIVGFRWFARSA